VEKKQKKKHIKNKRWKKKEKRKKGEILSRENRQTSREGK